MPAIRVQNWIKVYQSILGAWDESFELIVVSHIPLPKVLQCIPNIRWIFDEGCPTRKTQIGLLAARGKYVTYFVDDGVYVPGKLMELYNAIGFDDPVTLKYGESLDGNSHLALMESDDYYTFQYHPILHIPGIPSMLCKVLSFAAMPTELLKDIGGFDSQFEHIAMAETDLSVRMEKFGIRINISPEIILKLTWQPAEAGDHAPVHNAQMDHDLPLFLDMYKDDAFKDRTKIDINNWESSPSKWERRK